MLMHASAGGEAAGGIVETVLIPVVREQGQRARITLCVSTQVRLLFGWVAGCWGALMVWPGLKRYLASW